MALGKEFLKEFLATPNVTGAIAPSSRGLAKAIVCDVGIHEAGVVVEFGPGNWAIHRGDPCRSQARSTFYSDRKGVRSLLVS